MGEGLIRSSTLRFEKEGSRVCWGGLATRNAKDQWGLPNVSVKANKKSTSSIVTDDLSIIKNYGPKPTSHNSLSIWTKKFETKEHHNPKAQLYMEFHISYA
jgi:hypothetical protein